LTQDMLQADGSAVELLQKKSYIKSQADDAKDVNDTEVQEAKQMIDTVISDISAVKSSRAEFNNDKDPDYSRRTIQAELAKKHAEAMISNETTNLQEGSSQEAPEEAPAGLLDYWTLVGEGKWCNNMVGAVKSQHIVAAHGHTKESCQAACARDFSCNFYCFDKSNEGWCTTYEECGVPTTNPNGFSQNLQDAVTYKKENEQTHARAVAEELRNIEAESMSRIFVADAHIKVPTLKEAEKIAYRQAKQALKQKYAEAEAALKQKYAEAEAALQDVPPESSDVDSEEKPADEERKTFEEYDKLADKLLEDMTDKEDEARKMEVGKLKTRVAPPVEEHTKLHERAPPTDTRVKPMIKTADKEAEPAEEEAKPAEEAPKEEASRALEAPEEEAKPAEEAPKVEAKLHKADSKPVEQAREEAKPAEEAPKEEANTAVEAPKEEVKLAGESPKEEAEPAEEEPKEEASTAVEAPEEEEEVKPAEKAPKQEAKPAEEAPKEEANTAVEAPDEARLKAEQEAKRKADKEARIQAELEAKKTAEEARLKAEQEAKRKADEQARIQAELEAKRKAEEEARLKAEQEAKRKAEEEARIQAELKAKRKAEEEARYKAEQEAKLPEEAAAGEDVNPAGESLKVEAKLHKAHAKPVEHAPEEEAKPAKEAPKIEAKLHKADAKPVKEAQEEKAKPAEEAPKEEANTAEEAPKEEAKPAGAPKVEARPHKAHLTQPAKQVPVEEAKPVDEMPKAEAKQADTRLKVEPKPEKQIPKEETLKKEASRGRNAQQSETNLESLTKAIKKIKHPNALAKSAQKPEKEPEQEEEVESEEEPKKQKAEKLRKREEFRLDHDGHAYTKQDFLDYYGDLKAWDMAPEAHMKHLQSRHEITHDVFEETKEKVSRQPQNKLVPRRQEVAQDDKSASMQDKSKDARAIEDKANVTVNKTCATTEGAACVFPFVYLGLHYNTCTYVDGKGEPWCVTNKGDMGWLMGKRPEGAFGICNTACQEAGMVDEDNTDAKTWATAELSAPEAEDDDLPWEKEESIKKKRHEKQEEKPQAEPKKEDEDVKHRNDKAKAPAPKIRALKHEEDNSSLGHQKHVLQERVGPSAAASRSANTVTDKLVSRASIMDQVMADQTAEEEAAAAATTVEEVFDSISNALEEAVPAESDAKAACKTVAGAACVFPFVFKGVAYDKCTKAESTSGDAWCATTWANAAWLSGEIPKNEWGKCAPGCEE